MKGRGNMNYWNKKVDEVEKELEIVDIKFSVSTSVFGEEQIYCFSALILYKNV